MNDFLSVLYEDYMKTNGVILKNTLIETKENFNLIILNGIIEDFHKSEDKELVFKEASLVLCLLSNLIKLIYSMINPKEENLSNKINEGLFVIIKSCLYCSAKSLNYIASYSMDLAENKKGILVA